MRTSRVLLAAVLTAAALAVPLSQPFAAPAAAAPAITGRCDTVQHGDTKPFVRLNAAGTADTTGTHTLTGDGVKIVTPDAAAKVYGYLPLSPGLKLTDIRAAGFDNTTGGGLLPSYQFGLSVNGAWGGTLAWESIYQPAGKGGTGDVLHDGDSVWYVTKDHPGLPKHTQKTWKQILALLPAGTVATYYGLNQGAGGIATNTVNDLVLRTKDDCSKHVWSTHFIKPTVAYVHSCTGTTVTVSTTGPDSWAKVGATFKAVKAGTPAVFTVAGSAATVTVYRKAGHPGADWTVLDTFTWKKPDNCPTPSASVSASASASASASVSASASASSSSSAPGGATTSTTGAGALAVTGSNVTMPLLGVGFALVLAGGLVLLVLRRRRDAVTFEA